MTISKKVSPYGSWKSKISAEMVSENSIEINEITSDGGYIYWLENRPNESGRNVIMRCGEDGNYCNILPDGFNVRSRVHEYGGGSYKVYKGIVYFCNFEDQRIYSLIAGEDPIVLTPKTSKRYADFAFDSKRDRLICVCEDHNFLNGQVINSIIAISLKDDQPIVTLITGNDFYSNPRINPDNSKISWITWNHPHMPWDENELWVGTFDDNGLISQMKHIAGGNSESIFQPEWSPTGLLHFISDRSGWWNPYILYGRIIRSLCEINGEFGRPQWVFGLSSYGFLSETEIIYSVSSSGKDELLKVNTDSGIQSRFNNKYIEYSSIHTHNKKLFFVGYSKDKPAEMVRQDCETGESKVIRESGALVVNNECISHGREFKFPSQYNLEAYGNFYSPQNSEFLSTEIEKPPLIVMIHSGPTRSTSQALNMKVQYWTSRGFAVLDVNYSGSTGYGRAFRERLYGQWGKLDVIDCINGALHLAKMQLVDGNRISISGGSAGGYTALCALAFHKVFSAGVSRYGISSLEGIVSDSHKFESHYLKNLIGLDNLSTESLNKRSPINYIGDIHVPVLIMQGSEDKVVPVAQSEQLFKGLDNKHQPVSFILFEGEEHGFRKSETISRAIEIELYFYSRVFNFSLQENIEPIEIRNLQ